jgi:DNA-binding transcriptional MerR regulator
MTAPPVTRWTLDQLAERVEAALSVDYHGQVSGRVREVPDQRAIRYYTTIGLVDRPAAMRGRTALYARRHLLQLVAIKRLQAQGLSLARIQARLAGATDAQLEHVARVPALDEPAAATLHELAPAAAPRPAFWKRTAHRVPAPPTGFEHLAAGVGPRSAAPPSPAPTTTQGAGPAAEPSAASPTSAAAESLGAAPGAASPTSAATGSVAMQGVRLGDGVTLLVEGARVLRADEVAAIREAAGPLLDLVRRGRERS